MSSSGTVRFWRSSGGDILPGGSRSRGWGGGGAWGGMHAAVARSHWLDGEVAGGRDSRPDMSMAISYAGWLHWAPIKADGAGASRSSSK